MCSTSFLVIWSYKIKIYARYSSHDFVNVHLAIVEIFTDCCLVEDLFYVLHGVCSGISWERAGLTNWVHVSHVSHWWHHFFVAASNGVVYFLVGW